MLTLKHPTALTKARIQKKKGAGTARTCDLIQSNSISWYLSKGRRRHSTAAPKPLTRYAPPCTNTCHAPHSTNRWRGCKGRRRRSTAAPKAVRTSGSSNLRASRAGEGSRLSTSASSRATHHILRIRATHHILPAHAAHHILLMHVAARGVEVESLCEFARYAPHSTNTLCAPRSANARSRAGGEVAGGNLAARHRFARLERALHRAMDRPEVHRTASPHRRPQV